VQTKQLHVDTTSFFVRGEDASKGGQEGAGTPGVRETATDPARIAITYGSSREHRADLTQGMLAFATTPEGDIPLFFQPWDGNSSDPGAMMRQTSLWQTMGSPAKRR
jgi:transposase